MDILRREFDPVLSKGTKHYYIIEKFGMEARIKLNKAPLINRLPQMELDLLFGGQINSSEEDIGVKLNLH
jgi:hypothetical protein